MLRGCLTLTWQLLFKLFNEILVLSFIYKCDRCHCLSLELTLENSLTLFSILFWITSHHLISQIFANINSKFKNLINEYPSQYSRFRICKIYKGRLAIGYIKADSKFLFSHRSITLCLCTLEFAVDIAKNNPSRYMM